MLMQYGLLHTLAVALEILITSNLDVLHLHDFDAIIFLHLSMLMQETSMTDAIATSHQNNFDAITLLHLSILMQETTDGWCNSELSHQSQQTDATRLLHLELLHRLATNAKLMRYQAIASILVLLHQNFAGATGSKINSDNSCLLFVYKKVFYYYVVLCLTFSFLLLLTYTIVWIHRCLCCRA